MPGNDTSLHVGLLMKLLSTTAQCGPLIPQIPPPSPTIHTGTLSKALMHCIQEEFLRNNLIPWEFIASAYEFNCDDLVDNDSY